MDKHPFDGWVMVICNPVSGMGRGLERLAVVRRTLERARVRYLSELTRTRGDAFRMAGQASRSGCRSIIVIGGDGTLFEVVNGMVISGEQDGRPGGEVAVGLVQAGRGSDFGRSIGVPSDIEAACMRLLNGRTATIDLGYITYSSFSGKPQARYFVNAAGIGFDAEVTARANAGSRKLGGTLPYLSSLFTTLGRYHNRRVKITLDGGDAWPARVCSMVVANGQYFGGGMKIAPDAELSDGQFDVVLVGNLGKLDLVANVPRLYDGSHVNHPKVDVYRARQVTIESPDRVLLQADGEVLGTCPVTFRLVPQALQLIV